VAWRSWEPLDPIYGLGHVLDSSSGGFIGRLITGALAKFPSREAKTMEHGAPGVAIGVHWPAVLFFDGLATSRHFVLFHLGQRWPKNVSDRVSHRHAAKGSDDPA
jgi:hypothetical protein